MICFDTNVTIWAVRGLCDPGSEQKRDNAKAYLAFLQKKGKRILIPAPVVYEYLSYKEYDTPDRRRHLNVFERCFLIGAFDLEAATIAAELQAADDILCERPDPGKDRHHVRLDTLVVAIALKYKADAVISHDGHLRRIATDRIAVRDIPSVTSTQREQRVIEFGDEP